ncbi:MAG: hypothetical protein ACFFFC_00990 [Candidatus Thorarchaeota archaeon]
MPFKSKAQRRFMFAKHPQMAKEWAAHTPKGANLPEHVKQSAFFDELQQIIEAKNMAKHSGLGVDLRLKGPGNIQRPPFATEESKSNAFSKFKQSQNIFGVKGQPPKPSIRSVATI